MKKKLLIILILSSFSALGQEYSLWVSGNSQYESVNYSFCIWRRGFWVYYNDVNSSMPGKKVYNTGIYPITPNKTQIVGNSKLYKEPTPGCGPACEVITNFALNRLETVYIGIEGKTVPTTDCFPMKTTKAYTVERRLFQSAVILPTYVQPTGLDRERVLTDKLFKSPQNTFNIPQKTIPHVRWQYQINNQFFFKDFPSDIRNKFPLDDTITIADILKDEIWIDLNIVKSLKIKMFFSPPGVTIPGWPFPTTHRTPTVESPILIFDIFTPSPELIDPVVTKKTNCKYSSDGGFTLNFKRDLITSENENLVMTLYDGDDESIIYNQEDTKVLVDNGDGTYGYNWIKQLDKGNYKVRIQTQNIDGTINTSDPSWDKLDFSEIFTINNPKEVSFSITNTSDKTCFTTTDGFLDVKAEGELNRTFLYQLKKDGVVQFYKGTNWVNYMGTNIDDETWYNFTNPKSTRIRNLNKGTFQVKVRDSQGCFAREN